MTQAFKVIAYLSHPLFLSFYLLLFWLWLDPFSFGYHSYSDAFLLLFYTLIITVILPGLALLMMKKLQLIPSLSMPNRSDRVIPLIVCAVFYFWYYINCRSNPELPLYYKYLVFSVTLLLVIVFILSIFYKISLHTSAWGLMFTYGIVALDQSELFIGKTNLSIFIFVLIVLMLGGLVGSARIAVKAHTLKEVMIGYGLGSCVALIGFFIYY